MRVALSRAVNINGRMESFKVFSRNFNEYYYTLKLYGQCFLLMNLVPLTLWIPGDFSMLVYRGGVLFHTPFQNDFLLWKIIFFCPWSNFGQILALF